VRKEPAVLAISSKQPPASTTTAKIFLVADAKQELRTPGGSAMKGILVRSYKKTDSSARAKNLLPGS
jgi:hypothetical protein